MPKIPTLSPQDHSLVAHLGRVTGRTPGNTVRGLPPIDKAAMRRDHGEIIRSRVLKQMKVAEAGPSTQQQFSESFAAMAFTFLEERSPSLREFMLGFQVVDRGDDGDSAFGVFGFQLPNRVVQCPVFFLHGQVKGYQLLFVPAQQLFMPLHEGFVQRLINNDGTSNGEPGPRWGNMQTMADPSVAGGQMPTAMKYAATLKRHSPGEVLPWAEETGLYETVGSWLADTDTVQKYADLVKTGSYASSACDVDSVVSSNTHLFKTAAELALAFPAVYQAMRCNESDRMAKLAATAEENDQRRRDSLVLRRGFSTYDRVLGKTAKTSIAAPSTSVHYSDNPQPPRLFDKEASDKYRENLRRNGIVFFDNRSTEEVNTVEKIAINVEEDFKSVVLDKPCECTIVTRNAGQQDVYFIPSRFLEHNDKKHLIITKSGDSFAAVTDMPIVLGEVTDLDTEELIGALGKSTEVTGRGIYLAITPDGQMAGPFAVSRKKVDPKDFIQVRPELGRWDYEYIAMTDGSELTTERAPQETNEDGEKCIYLPKGTRFASFTVTEDEDADSMSPSPYGSSPGLKKVIIPESYTTIDFKELTKLTAKISKKAHGHYIINDKQMTRKHAACALVFGGRLREDAASDLLDSLDLGVSQRLLFKNAASGRMQHYNPDAIFPDLEGPAGQSEGGMVPYRVDNPEYAEATVPDMSEMGPDPSQYGIEDMDDSHPTGPPVGGTRDLGVSSELQRSMTQKVQGPMDVAVVASIVANSRVDGVLTEAAAQLMKGISETGKVLLLFYAQSAAFEDMYPENDLKPLEDTLLTAFEGSGDAYLRIKQQTMMSDPADDAAVPFDHTTVEG